MTGFLLGVVFAAGVSLLWLGLVVGVRLAPPRRAGRLSGLLSEAGVAWTPQLFTGAIVVAAIFGGLVMWWIAAVPALVIAGLIAGAYGPIVWVRSRRERLRRERERAWPAVLDQLADALEAGLAFPAGVALVAESGPLALRGEFATFGARLRGADLASALEGLRDARERTADSVVVLLRASLLELPTGGLAPVLRELSGVLSERLEAREKARSRASSVNLEAGILALSPIAIFLLIGAASPGYLDAYRSAAGTVVSLVGGGLIFGCYLLMRRLGRVPEPRRSHRSVKA
jgi:tight adherence protein B